MTSAFQLSVPSPSARGGLDPRLGVRLPAQQREQGAVDGEQPLLRGLAQIRDHVRHPAQVGLGGRDVPELHRRDEMLLQPVGDALSVAETRRDVDELRRERELPAGVRRAVVAEDVAVQAVGEGLVVVEAAGDLQRLGAHRPPAPPGGVGVAQRAAREADEQPHARRAVLGRQRRERPLEQHREQRIVARDVPDDPAAVAQGGLREVVGEIVDRGELGGLAERPLGGPGVARASADLADREQELAPRRCPACQASACS